jgi:putative transposase
MTSLFKSLLVVIAPATHRELACQIQYLKAENEILRGKLTKRIAVTPTEKKRLVRFASKLGKLLRQVVGIVAPETMLRWIREEKKATKPVAKRGRRKKPEEIRTLILKLARENDWGYTRILGELKKLGIKSVSRNTVKRILKENGLEPGPKRGKGTWDEFLKQHAVSLWQCDFFEQKVFTMQGIRSAFVLAFLNVKTRQVVFSPSTLQPNEAWGVQQADAFVKDARDRGLPIRKLTHDRDAKFPPTFDAALKRYRVEGSRTAFRSPNLNAFVERFIQSVQKVCLDHFAILGTTHLDHLCKEYLAQYHEERPHQAMKNEPLIGPKRRGTTKGKDESLRLRDVRCRQRLGGLLKSYSRRAA